MTEVYYIAINLLGLSQKNKASLTKLFPLALVAEDLYFNFRKYR